MSSKDAKRKKLEKQIEEYISRGGVIEEIPTLRRELNDLKEQYNSTFRRFENGPLAKNPHMRVPRPSG
jgi:hypothetical protein